MFQAAIIGCGRIAGINDAPRSSGFISTHAQAYQQHKKFNLTVIVDNNRANLKKFSTIWNVPITYNSLSKMLHNHKVDVISICAPSEFHAPIISEILVSKNYPKVIFVEKPVCLRREEFQELKKIVAKKKDCIVVVNHSRRFDPGHIEQAGKIKSGRLGEFISCRTAYYGGWLNNGCHIVDMLRMFFDKKLFIRSVSLGSSGRKSDPCLNIQANIGFAKVDINSFDEKYYQIFESELRFAKGRIIIQDFGARIIEQKVVINKSGERELKFTDKDSYIRGMDSPLYYAIDLIGAYLEKKCTLEGRGILFKEAEETMDILWAAKDLLKKDGKQTN